MRLACLLLVLPVVVSGSSAWTTFVNYKAPVVAPEEAAPALNLASQRRTTSSASFSIQPEQDASSGRFVVPNDFTANSLTDQYELKMRVFELCKNGAAGTSFEATVTHAWNAAAAAGGTNETKSKYMPPQCATCMAKGWGVNSWNYSPDPTPGYYLPCGCQETCVDVSGNMRATFNKIPTSASLYNYAGADSTYTKLGGSMGSTAFPSATTGDGSSGNAGYQQLKTCQDYLDNRLTYTCSGIAEFQTAIWVGILMAIIFVYTAVAMSGMQLDMDSLLYTVGGPGSKKDQ